MTNQTRLCLAILAVYVELELGLAGAQEAQLEESPRYQLFDAINLYDLDEARRLVESGVDPASPNVLGQTALHSAANACCRGELETADEEFIRYLVDQGVDINAPSVAYESILELDRSGVRWDGELPSKQYTGRTPLHAAVLWQNETAIPLLVELGAEVDARTAGGMTPLMYAAQACLGEVTKTLLAHGADPNLASNRGTTALHFALKENTDREHLVGVEREAAVRALIRAGINLDARDKSGKTPLDYVEDATERPDWEAKIRTWQKAVQE